MVEELDFVEDANWPVIDLGGGLFEPIAHWWERRELFSGKAGLWVKRKERREGEVDEDDDGIEKE